MSHIISEIGREYYSPLETGADAFLLWREPDGDVKTTAAKVYVSGLKACVWTVVGLAITSGVQARSAKPAPFTFGNAPRTHRISECPGYLRAKAGIQLR